MPKHALNASSHSFISLSASSLNLMKNLIYNCIGKAFTLGAAGYVTFQTGLEIGANYQASDENYRNAHEQTALIHWLSSQEQIVKLVPDLTWHENPTRVAEKARQEEAAKKQAAENDDLRALVGKLQAQLTQNSASAAPSESGEPVISVDPIIFSRAQKDGAGR